MSGIKNAMIEFSKYSSDPKAVRVNQDFENPIPVKENKTTDLSP